MRSATACCLFALLLAAGPALAQEGGEPLFDDELEAPSADSANPAPIPGDPTISLSMPANPNDLLTGLYATRATADICGIAIAPEIAEAMAADEARFLEALSLPPEAASGAYAQIHAAIAAAEPDCSAEGAEVTGVTEVLDVYATAAP